MKFLETHFDEYIQKVNMQNLHPSVSKTLRNFPTNIDELKNIIYYGPCGVGKYSQMLHSIKQYSNSNLKYEKKLTCVYNKTNYFLKISDIHFEIDMALLGCNSKMLWNEIYINITDVLSARMNKTGILVCKNFHKIHPELLDCFYSYIQQNDANIKIAFILLTESISFIPENVLNTFNIISIPRPSKNAYTKVVEKKIGLDIQLHKISNIKNLISNTQSTNVNNDIYIDILYGTLCNPDDIKFAGFRDMLYDVFIYDIEIGYVIWNLVMKLYTNNKLKEDDLSYIFIETYSFLQYYNNNYRPIYHLENYLYKIINKVHGF